jgi:hypothetical protein
MGVEKFIIPKHDTSKHPSMRCHQRRFEAAISEQQTGLSRYSGLDFVHDVYVAPKKHEQRNANLR